STAFFMTPIDSTTPRRVESPEWITGSACLSSRSVKRVLIVEDSYLVRGIDRVKGWYVQRREPMESRESQCVAKIFLRAQRPRGGGRPRLKLENRKIENGKTRKSEFSAFPEKRRKS